MINAYILVRMHPGYSVSAIHDLRHLPSVEKVSVIAGDYDIVVRAGVKNLEHLSNLNNNIQQIKGLQKTTTHVIEKEISL